MKRVREAVVRLAMLALMLGGVAACEQPDVITWREEVALHDGKTLVVTRSITLGGGAREPGAHMSGETDYALSFTAPHGRAIAWENPRKLMPMLLDFVDGVPYLATSPTVVIEYFNYGCPEPAYVFFKYIGGWQRISFEQFPRELRSPNLLMGYKRASDLRGRFLHPGDIAKANKSGGLGRDYLTINPERHSSSPCPRTEPR